MDKRARVLARQAPSRDQLKASWEKLVEVYKEYNRLRFWEDHRMEEVQELDAAIQVRVQQKREMLDRRRLEHLRNHVGRGYVREVIQTVPQRYRSPNWSPRLKRQLPPADVTAPPVEPPKSSDAAPST